MTTTTKPRQFFAYGIAPKVGPNRAGRTLDENDVQCGREAQAIRTARGLTPARTRRYEDHTGADIERELIHGRR